MPPIDLPLLPGGGLKPAGELAQAPVFLAQGPQEIAQDRTAPRIPLGLDLLGQPHRGQLRAFHEAAFELGFEGVQLRGLWDGASILGQAVAAKRSAYRVSINAQLPGNRPDRQPLLLQVFDHHPGPPT